MITIIKYDKTMKIEQVLYFIYIVFFKLFFMCSPLLSLLFWHKICLIYFASMKEIKNQIIGKNKLNLIFQILIGINNNKMFASTCK